MKNHIKKAAQDAAKCKRIRQQVISFIKTGSGYSNPTDFYFDFDDQIPKKYKRYFEGAGLDFDKVESPIEEKLLYDELSFSKIADPSIECLYSVKGARALLDAVLDYYIKK